MDGIGNKRIADRTSEDKRKDHKAMYQIQLHLHNNILQDVLTEKTGAAIWSKLEGICMTKDLTSKIHLKQKKKIMHMLQDGGNVLNRMSQFKEIINDLLAMAVKYEE
jgi:hypothetical protein